MSKLEVVTKHSPGTGPGNGFMSTDYLPIFKFGFGRMNKNTPGPGLSTWGAIDTNCMVFHCSDTGRTVLTHCSWDTLMSSSFKPIIDWLRDANASLEVEAVLLRGYAYGTMMAGIDNEEAFRMRSDIRDRLEMYPGKVNLYDCPQILTSGALLVDKVTGRITILQNKWCMIISNPNLPQDYQRFQSYVDVLTNAFADCISQADGSGVLPLHLQFDGQRYLLPNALPSELRLMLRSNFLDEPKASQESILDNVAQGHSIINPLKHCCMILTGMFNAMKSRELPCERCDKKGDRRCLACFGAWYCSKEHQEEDWINHKVWSKLHRIKK